MSKITRRPVIMGRHGMVTSGHYLATSAGLRIMEQGGNAIDAAAAMCFCLNLLEPQNCGIGGEAPTLIYSSKEQKVFAVSGLGWSPKEFSIEWCRKRGIDLIPGDGYLPACVPAVVDTWATALSHFGTMSFSQILSPAIDLAENGFPMYQGLHSYITADSKKYTTIYPSTGKLYCPNGQIPEVGQLIRNPDWARTLQLICQAEKAASGKGRNHGIEAGRNAFYKGEIAEQIVNFISANPVEDFTGSSHRGILSYEDISEWHATLEEPIVYNYSGLDVHKCSSWTQGPVFLQQLSILENFDLRSMKHNSPEYIHTLIEAAKLAFADREAYYGDPLFDNVPLNVLLSKKYGAARSNLIEYEASAELRPGDVGHGIPEYVTFDVLKDHPGANPSHRGDTTHLDAADNSGNLVSCTPSGGWLRSSPVISGLGFPLGTRGQMFYLNPNRPNALQPRKRPRATLTPTLVTKNNQPFMAFGTPGGDSQDQWTLQFFLNYIHFDMNIQESIESPTFFSIHFPSSFYPREAYPKHLKIENRFSDKVINELKRRGHEIILDDDWSHGKVMGIRYDTEQNVILGGVSPRGVIGYGIGW